MLKNIKLSRYVKTMAILASFLIAFTGMAKAFDVSGNNVRISDNNNSYSVKTSAKTVDELLSEEEISLNELDVINAKGSDVIKENMEIVIKRAFYVNVIIDGGEPIKIKTNYDTIGKIISDLRKEHGEEYLLEGGSSSFAPEPNMQIKLNSIKEVLETRTEEIPFETSVVENPELLEGTEKVSKEGENGQKEIEVKTVYVGGKVSSITESEPVVVKEPVNKVIEKGTKKPEPEPVAAETKTNGTKFNAKKEFSMRATAYTATGNRTASGMKAAVGVVAVDPKVIPLGSRLYIEGYGYAIAGDTGGAIKNNRIDLFFNTERECVNYGVKNNVKVYLLG